MCEALEELMKDKIEAIVKAQVEAKVKEQVEVQVNIAEMRVAKLMAMLSKQGRSDDIIKAAEDKQYQEELMREFEL